MTIHPAPPRSDSGEWSGIFFVSCAVLGAVARLVLDVTGLLHR